MVNIQAGMGEEIIEHMETILYRPDKQVLGARYCVGVGAVQVFYLDSHEVVFMNWCKLREEVNDSSAAHVVAFFEAKIPLVDFYNFIIHEKAPVYEMTDFAKRYLQ